MEHKRGFVIFGNKKISYSDELAKDMEKYHGVDIEAELTRILADEIDREILDKIKGTSSIQNNISKLEMQLKNIDKFIRPSGQEETKRRILNQLIYLYMKKIMNKHCA